jgi:hypothetical protein
LKNNASEANSRPGRLSEFFTPNQTEQWQRDRNGMKLQNIFFTTSTGIKVAEPSEMECDRTAR